MCSGELDILDDLDSLVSNCVRPLADGLWHLPIYQVFEEDSLQLFSIPLIV